MHNPRRQYRYMRAPVMGGHWRLRQLRQFDFGYQYEEINDETKLQYLRVVIPLPGISPDGLKVKAKERLLTVSASVSNEFRDYATRPDDSWDIVLEQAVKPDTAKAKYSKGVLFVDIELAYPSSDVNNIEYEKE